jgi:hypothetical protein
MPMAERARLEQVPAVPRLAKVEDERHVQEWHDRDPAGSNHGLAKPGRPNLACLDGRGQGQPN